MDTGSSVTLKKTNITARAYLTIEGKQDIEEIYGYIDADRKGYFTDQELHAALNEAVGKPISAKAVRALATRMDASGHGGAQVLHHDFVEYMAQKMQLAEPFDELMRSEQAQLMREVGSKVYEVLELFKRRQMLKDAMRGGEGIKRLLKLTHVPISRPNRRKAPTGSKAQQRGAGGPAGAAASRPASARTTSPQRSSPSRRRLESAASGISSAAVPAGGDSARVSASGGTAHVSSGGGVARVSANGGSAPRASTNGGVARSGAGGGARVSTSGAPGKSASGARLGGAGETEGGPMPAPLRVARRTSSSPSRLASTSFGHAGSAQQAAAGPGTGRRSGGGEQRSPARLADEPSATSAAAAAAAMAAAQPSGPEAERAARLALVAAAAAAGARPPDLLVSAQVGGAAYTFSVRRLGSAATLPESRPGSARRLDLDAADAAGADITGSFASRASASAGGRVDSASGLPGSSPSGRAGPAALLPARTSRLAHATSARAPRPASALAGGATFRSLGGITSKSLGGAAVQSLGASSGPGPSSGSAGGGGAARSGSWRSPELLAQVLDCLGRSGLSDPELQSVAQGLGLVSAPEPGPDREQETEGEQDREAHARAYVSAVRVGGGGDGASGKDWGRAAGGADVAEEQEEGGGREVPDGGDDGEGPGGAEAGARLRGGSRSRAEAPGAGGGGPRAMPNVLLGTPAADAVVLDVSDPLESDPLLAKLPGWIRKRLGLPLASAPTGDSRPGDSAAEEQARPQTPQRAASAGSAAAVATSPGASPGTSPGRAAPRPPLSPFASIGSSTGVSEVQVMPELATRDGERGSTGDGASCAPAESPSIPTTPSRRAASRPLSGRSAGSLMRYMPFGGDTAAVVAEEGAEEEGDAPAALAPLQPPSPKAWLPATPSPLQRSSLDENDAAVVGVTGPAGRPRSASPSPCPSPSATAPHRDFSLRRPASASASATLSGRATPAMIVPPPPPLLQRQGALPRLAAEADEEPPAAEVAAAGCFGSPSKRRSTAAWLAAAADAEPEAAVDGALGSPKAGDGGSMAGMLGAGRDEWVLSQLSSMGASFVVEGEGLDGDEEQAEARGGQARQGMGSGRVEPAGPQRVAKRYARDGVRDGGEVDAEEDGSTAMPYRGSAVSSLVEPHLATAAAALVEAAAGRGPFLPDPRAQASAPAARPRPQVVPQPDSPPTDGRRPGIVSQLASPAELESGPGGRPVRWLLARSSRTLSQARSPSPSASQRAHSARGCRASDAVRTYAGPPFLGGPASPSPDMPPSAFQVVAAAEAALAEAEAARADAGSGKSSAGGCATRWSTDYPPPAVVVAVATAPDRAARHRGAPAVHLNRSSLLRFNSQYGAEAVAAAGATLGLRRSSAAARDVAAREVLRSLSCAAPRDGSGGAGGGAGGNALGEGSSGGAAAVSMYAHATAGPELWPMHSASAAYRPDPALPAQGGGSGGAPAAATAWGAQPQPRRPASAAAEPPARVLPTDVLAFGRQLRTLAARMLSEGAAASRPNSAGQRRPSSPSRPGSAAPHAASPSPSPSPIPATVPRPASARRPSRPASAAVTRSVERPASALTHGSASAASTPAAAAARPRSASAACTAAAVLPPSRTRPSIVSRVQGLDAEEVSSCLSAAPAPVSTGPAVCSASEIVSRRSLLVPLLRMEQAAPSSRATSDAGTPGSARSGAAGDGLGYGGVEGLGGRGDGADAGGGNEGEAHGPVAGSALAVRVVPYGASRPPSAGPDGALVGVQGQDGASGAGERRRLEVTGTTALPQAQQEGAGGAARKVTWRQALSTLGS